MLLISACASVSPRESFGDVSRAVQESGGPAPHWDQGSAADAQVQARIREMLRGTLSPDAAVEVAFLRNQGLVVIYEELGIAQADLVQAGLLRNPSVGARIRFPANAGATELDFSLTEDFLDLFTLPLRKRVAAAQLDAAKARVGNSVLALSAQVRQAVVELQAAQATAQMRKLVLAAQQAAAELRRKQHAAGNIGDLELAQEEAFYQQEKLAVVVAEAEVLHGRERLNRLMGVWGEESASWRVAETMPELPAQEPDLSHIESLAVARRLDLAAARKEVATLEQAASLSGVTRAFPAVQAGVSTGRDPEGIWVVGPDLTLELPIFDQGQARVARIAAQLRQARARQQELAVNIRAEVRELRSRLLTDRGVVDHYREVLLPLRERLVQQAQLRYNAMLLGVFQLLLARREQIDAYRDYLSAIRDYWTTHADLERAAAGRLTAVLPEEKKP
jgi:cobalt-zinc-cadmium efflux system outer membrane protein